MPRATHDQVVRRDRLPGGRRPDGQPLAGHDHGTPVAPAALKPINAVLAFRFTISKATTRLMQLKVKNLPKGATVSITCKGPSCPKKLKGSGYTMKSKGNALSLSTLVKSNLKSGTTLNIAISSSGADHDHQVPGRPQGQGPGRQHLHRLGHAARVLLSFA